MKRFGPKARFSLPEDQRGVHTGHSVGLRVAPGPEVGKTVPLPQHGNGRQEKQIGKQNIYLLWTFR